MMDAPFVPLQLAIQADDTAQVLALLEANLGLASQRSAACDHPYLLNCLVLSTPPRTDQSQLIARFAELGSNLTSGLGAAASIGNVAACRQLLDLGASLTGEDGWSPLEEALYWGHTDLVSVLLERGAAVDNLRKFAALGDLVGLARCFDASGRLNEQAGTLAWPFGGAFPESVLRDPQILLDNALIYAAAWGQIAAAELLLQHGAQINAIPLGFDFAGTALHYAALNNRRAMVEWLLSNGADPTLEDAKVHNRPDGWASFAEHHELAEYLGKARRAYEAGRSSRQ